MLDLEENLDQSVVIEKKVKKIGGGRKPERIRILEYCGRDVSQEQN